MIGSGLEATEGEALEKVFDKVFDKVLEAGAEEMAAVAARFLEGSSKFRLLETLVKSFT